MEERTITISINTAREWYKEGGFKREMALKLFSEDELNSSYKHIVTFEDACEAVGLKLSVVTSHINDLKEYYFHGENLIAQYKLNIIRKALNGDWNPKLNEGKIYFSWLYWYPSYESNYPKEWNKVGEIINLDNDGRYTIISNTDYSEFENGLGDFGYDHGIINDCAALFACKSKEIALHLMRYFGHIAFDAVYGQYNNYRWIYAK